MLSVQILAARTMANWAKRQTRGMERVLTTFATWQKRTAMRREIARMQPHTLRDIGLTPWEAQAEQHKPFWRA